MFRGSNISIYIFGQLDSFNTRKFSWTLSILVKSDIPILFLIGRKISGFSNA